MRVLTHAAALRRPVCTVNGALGSRPIRPPCYIAGQRQIQVDAMNEELDVRLSLADRDDAPILDNLLQLYIHDLSEAFQVDVGPNGRFGYGKLSLYWDEPERRYPFLIRASGQLAGFALIARGSPATTDPTDLDVAEFFVLRRYRRMGVGRQAAFRLWNGTAGRWVVRVSDGNRPALPFWRTVVAEFTHGAFSEEKQPGTPHPWSVLIFHSPPRSPSAGTP
jgi:predicted acetyltransferase